MKIGFLGPLGLLFIALKLTGFIAWSWWLVLLPLWALPAVACIFLLSALVVDLALAVYNYFRE